MKRRISILLPLLLLLLSTAALADGANGANGGKNLTVRTYQLKHKQAESAVAAIKSLLTAEGSISIQPATSSLVITDRPESVKKVIERLEQFDTPPQPFKLTIRVVSAGHVPADRARIDPALEDIAPKLTLLRYNALETAGSAEVVGSEGDPGLVDLNSYRADFKFGDYDAASDSLQIVDFKLLRLGDDQLEPVLKTTLNLKLGQMVIIGATRQPESQRALVIVFTAKR
jgi:Bacterial type II/III secretion system short domain